MIRKIKNKDIDKSRWDELIYNSSQSSVYALSGFLDTVCPNWEGLILNDYEAVFPLPIKQKLFFKYLVQPIFSQQYSIFSSRELSSYEKSLFIQEITLYKSIRLCLSMPYMDFCKERANYILDLSIPLSDIRSNYSINTVRNIKKSQTKNLQCRQLYDKEAAIEAFLSVDEKKRYSCYKKPIKKILEQVDFESYLVCDDSKEYAVAIFLKTKNRLYYLFPASTNEGRQKSAMFTLIDFVIQKYAGTQMILDFEGSEIEGVKDFYEGFGSEKCPYFYFERHSFPLICYFFKNG
ncbi:MAG: hypothetical protein MJ198_03050 [Bacteroidales bacterium]|nr:hypothetical protein [Bacteroidales bacterium]